MEFPLELPTNYSWASNATNVETLDRLHTVFAMSERLTIVLGLLQVSLGTIFNAFLLVVVLGRKEVRADVRNMLIANVAVADLLFSAVLHPVEMAAKIQEAETDDKARQCHVHIVLQLLYMFAFNFVSAWGVVCLDSLLLARLARLDMPLTSFLTSALTTSISVWKRRVDRAVVAVVIALPWVTSVAVVTPVVFSGLHAFHERVWSAVHCPFILEVWARVSLNVVFFFLPCLVALIVLSVSGCAFCYRRRRGGIGVLTPSTTAIATAGEDMTSSSSGFQDHPGAYVAGTLVTFALMGPNHLVSMLNQVQGSAMLADVPSWLMLRRAVLWVSESKAACLPLVWLLFLPDLRARAWKILTFGKRAVFRSGGGGAENPAANNAGFDPSVSYRNINH